MRFGIKQGFIALGVVAVLLLILLTPLLLGASSWWQVLTNNWDGDLVALPQGSESGNRNIRLGIDPESPLRSHSVIRSFALKKWQKLATYEVQNDFTPQSYTDSDINELLDGIMEDPGRPGHSEKAVRSFVASEQARTLVVNALVDLMRPYPGFSYSDLSPTLILSQPQGEPETVTVKFEGSVSNLARAYDRLDTYTVSLTREDDQYALKNVAVSRKDIPTLAGEHIITMLLEDERFLQLAQETSLALLFSGWGTGLETAQIQSWSGSIDTALRESDFVVRLVLHAESCNHYRVAVEPELRVINWGEPYVQCPMTPIE